MNRAIANRSIAFVAILACLLFSSPLLHAEAATQPASSKTDALYDRITPSLVVVQYVWENELGREEVNGAGIIVNPDGLVMTSLSLFDIPMRGQIFRVPDAQMKEFKILVPSQKHDADEIPATFVGRDDRTGVAFIKTTKPQKWSAIKFDPSVHVNVGDHVVSIGLLPKNAAYKTYLTQGVISATLRGETPELLVVGGGLGCIGSPVFDVQGRAIGLVNTQPNQFPFLNESRVSLASLVSPPILFTPASDFEISLKDPPVAGKELALPWLGVPEQAMAGLNKDVAESLGLKDQPAIEVGDVIPGSPIEKAGIKPGNIIVKVNDKPLAPADTPEELPGILARQIRRMKVGNTVTLGILTAKGQPIKDIKVKLEERPAGANLAKRWYTDELGFGVRNLVFMDSYARKIPASTKGVVVTIVKPQGAASVAKLESNDLITELNGQHVTDLADFRKQLQTLRKDKPQEAIVLVVLRDANTQTIRIEPPQ